MDRNKNMALHKKNTVAHFTDLKIRAEKTSCYQFSEFHSITDSAFFSDAGIKAYEVDSYGGYEGAERVVFRFGNKSQVSYEEPYPIDIIKITASSSKFGELTHPDVLGTIMGLGIERDRIGDIKFSNDPSQPNTAYVFALSSISEYIKDNISMIRKMSVTCEITDSLPESIKNNFQNISLIISSERADCFVSSITKKSRSQASLLISEKKVLLNGMLVQKNTTSVKPGDVLVIRGYGKYIYEEITGKTGSDNLHVTLRKYM